jgi:hypothetical protein
MNNYDGMRTSRHACRPPKTQKRPSFRFFAVPMLGIIHLPIMSTGCTISFLSRLIWAVAGARYQRGTP